MGAETDVSNMENVYYLEILPSQTPGYSIAEVHIHHT